MTANRKRRGRGEGGVHFDETRGLWVGSVSLGYHPDGRRNRPVEYGKSKRQVVEALDKLRAGAGAAPDAAGMTVGRLLDAWLEAKEQHTEELTHEGRVRASVRVRSALGGVAVRKLTALRVSQFYADLRKSGATRSACWHAARALCWALSYAVSLQIIPASPADLVALPPMKHREMIVLSAAQAQALLAAARGTVGHPLIAVALGTGIRQGELLGLSWPDVDLDAGTLSVRRSLSYSKAGGFKLKEPKTKSSRRTITLPAFALEALRKHREARRQMLRLTVFCSDAGGHRHRARLGKYLERAARHAEGAEIPAAFTWHCLRHTHASLLLSQGHSIKAVSHRLGHASAATTLRVYAHLMPGDDARLAEGIQALLG